MKSDISALEMAMPESRCVRCGKRIRRGHPRFVAEFKEFGIGPGYPGFTSEALEEDRIQNEAYDGEAREFGLVSSQVLVFCGPCAGEDPTIGNPWHVQREQRAADDSGDEELCKHCGKAESDSKHIRCSQDFDDGTKHQFEARGRSVWATPVSQVRIGTSEISGDYKFVAGMGKYEPSDLPSPARTEAEDRFLSGHLTQREASAKPNGRSQFTEDDRRHRMARFLLTPESRKMKSTMRKMCELWAGGMTQPEVARQVGISQGQVCKSIQNADAMAINYSNQAGKK